MIAEDALMQELKTLMEKAISVLEQDFSGLRTGRANVALLDKVMVDAYGAKTPLQHVATVTVLEPRVLGVQVWDPGNIKAVEKAIHDSVNITPVAEGQLMRIIMPEMSEEARRDILKVAASYAERARVGLRNIRREFIDRIKADEKTGDLSEDDLHRLQAQVTKETTRFVEKVDELLSEKSKRIQAV